MHVKKELAFIIFYKFKNRSRVCTSEGRKLRSVPTPRVHLEIFFDRISIDDKKRVLFVIDEQFRKCFDRCDSHADRGNPSLVCRVVFTAAGTFLRFRSDLIN